MICSDLFKGSASEPVLSEHIPVFVCPDIFVNAILNVRIQYICGYFHIVLFIVLYGLFNRPSFNKIKTEVFCGALNVYLSGKLAA